MNFLRKLWRWMRTDGLLHLETSFVLVIVLTAFMSPIGRNWFALFLGVLATILIGFAKELYDRDTGKGTAEWHDVYCDIAGILLSVLMVILLWVR